MKLEGKVALVTGGGQGIGKGIAMCLAENGADVAIIDLNGENARKVAQTVEGLGRKSLAIEADATEGEPVKKAVEDVLAHFGQIDILVNNVGGSKGVPARSEPPNILNRTEGEWQGSYEINLKSHILAVHAVAPHMIKQRSGKIVNISSDAAKQPNPGLMPYSAFKAADVSFTRSLAAELARSNINVNCILPGLIYTPLWASGATAYHAMALKRAKEGQGESVSVEELEKMTPKEWWLRFIVAKNTPLGRDQTPEDIGKAVSFLVSEDAKNITGQALSIDGGLVMH